MVLRNHVLVLGTAQDGGLPHVGCACAVCETAERDSAARRLVASIAVVGETGRVLLVDATPDVAVQLSRLSLALERPPPAVDGVLVTHAHVGHYLGLAHLGREGLDVSGLPLHCTESTAAFVLGNRPWAHLVTRGNVSLERVEPGEPFSFDGLELTPIHSPHRAEDTDTIGLLVAGPSRRLVYVPDADGFTPELVAHVEASDVALVDGTFHDREEVAHRDVDEVPHPFVAESVSLLARAAGRVFFTHLNHTNRLLHPDADRRAELPAGFALLEDGAAFAL